MEALVTGLPEFFFIDLKSRRDFNTDPSRAADLARPRGGAPPRPPRAPRLGVQAGGGAPPGWGGRAGLGGGRAAARARSARSAARSAAAVVACWDRCSNRAAISDEKKNPETRNPPVPRSGAGS